MTTNTVKRGDLYFLLHPGEVQFSGYGLAVNDERANYLVGLLMIDRPFPVSVEWLHKIAEKYGVIELYPMTATQERGIACQMWIADESMQHVRQLDAPVSVLLQAALRPFLMIPPNPQLDVRWDAEISCWTSVFHEVIGGPQPSGGLKALFRLGMVVATPGALAALAETRQFPAEFLQRHVTGDWGELDVEDTMENERALKYGNRLFSAYRLADGTKIWVITEWDRSVTTILLPSEY